MSKRLQIVVEDKEFDEIHRTAEDEGLSMSEWVRRALRDARRRRSGGHVARKLAAIRAASELSFPTADIDQMNAEIERGYRSE